jgi:HlyD family secretion protein
VDHPLQTPILELLFQGTILEIPIKEGDQVIQANTFNAGSTIATIADLNKMIFEGQVDEGEVGKLSTGNALSSHLRSN